MPIEVSSQSAQFIDAAVASGAFHDSAEVVDRAISLLRERQEAIDRILTHPVPLPEIPALLERQADGYVAIRGHRLGLHLLLQRHFAGESAAQIQDRFPSLTLAEVDEIVSLADMRSDAMRAYLDQQQLIQRLLMDDAHRGPTLEELRARWQAKFCLPFDSKCA